MDLSSSAIQLSPRWPPPGPYVSSSVSAALPGSVFHLLTEGLGEARLELGICRCLCWDAQRLLSPNATAQTSKSLHCLGWGVGESAWISHAPNSGFGFHFPLLHGSQREEKKERKPLKTVSCSVHSAIHLAAEPSDTPTVQLLATRQLFPFYDISGFRCLPSQTFII